MSEPSPFNTPEARLRVLSAAVLAPIVLVLVWLGNPAFAGLVALMAGAGMFEWLRLVDPDAPKPESYGLYGCLVLSMVLAMAGIAGLGLVVIALGGVIFYVQRSNTNPERALWFALGLPYMAGSGVALIYLRGTPNVGLLLTTFLFAAVWGMDIGAYVVGRIVGGPKLMPSVSPNKTWAGFCGGLALGGFSALCVLLVGHAAHLILGFLIAMGLAAVAQGGDLFKSFFKRRAGVKDCGTLIPGHGGVLDRIDGLVFAALLLAFLQAVFGRNIIW